MIKFTIQGRFPSLNEYIAAERSNKHKAASIKKTETERVMWEIVSQKVSAPVLPIWVSINWYEPNERRDIDNITWSKKFILDGMQKAKLIPDDNRKNVVQISDHVYTDKDNPRIEVIMYEGGVPFD